MPSNEYEMNDQIAVNVVLIKMLLKFKNFQGRMEAAQLQFSHFQRNGSTCNKQVFLQYFLFR